MEESWIQVQQTHLFKHNNSKSRQKQNIPELQHMHTHNIHQGQHQTKKMGNTGVLIHRGLEQGTGESD